jgi:hypothetical protein
MSYFHPWVDSCEDNFFLNTFPPSCSESELAAWITAFENFYKMNHAPFAIVHDCSQVLEIKAINRQQLTDNFKRNLDYMNQYCAGIAYYSESRLINSVIKVIYYNSGAAHPYFVSRDREECVIWAENQLAGMQG